jgi:uncharacterized membrane protein
MNGFNMMDDGFFTIGFGWVFPVVFMISMIYLIKYVFVERNSSIQDILNERYAKGLITKEEYEEKSKTLAKDKHS